MLLPVIRNLGGCGSTLLGRILAALPGTLILSECNPRSAYLFNGVLNPINQLRSWHSELLPVIDGIDEQELGYPPTFGILVEKLYNHLHNKGYKLIVRDYNYVDFIGYPFIFPYVRDSSLDTAIAGKFDVRDIVLVRYPADQLASLRKHYCMRDLPAQRFVDGYIDFLFQVNAPIFQYERLVNQPNVVMSDICNRLGLLWDGSALQSFTDIVNITGNLDRCAERALTKPDRSESALLAQNQLEKCYRYNDLLNMCGYLE